MQELVNFQNESTRKGSLPGGEVEYLLSKPGCKVLLQAGYLRLGFQQQAPGIGCRDFCHVKAGVQTLADSVQDSERPHDKCECGWESADSSIAAEWDIVITLCDRSC